MPGYAYNASAIGLGGVIQRGDLKTVIPTVASVCLSPSGGDGSVCYENYYRDDISFARAECRVSGTEGTGPNGGRRHITYSEVYLRDLKIFDRIRIAVMQATMTSTREVQDRGPLAELDHDQTEFDIYVLYRGIEIDGSEVAPDVDGTFCGRLNYQRFADSVLNSGRARRILDSDDSGIEDNEFAALAADRKPFAGSVVRAIGGRHYPSDNHKVKVGRFGNVKFGEILVKPDRQRFNLLRLDLTSDWTGNRQPLPNFGGDGDAVVANAVGDFMLAMSDPTGGGGGSVSAASGGSNGILVYP